MIPKYIGWDILYYVNRIMKFKEVKQFFIDNNCLRPFINNCLSNKNISRIRNSILVLTNCNLKRYAGSNPIRRGFVWSETKEGGIYWNNLAKKFDEYHYED